MNTHRNSRGSVSHYLPLLPLDGFHAVAFWEETRAEHMPFAVTPLRFLRSPPGTFVPLGSRKTTRMRSAMPALCYAARSAAAVTAAVRSAVNALPPHCLPFTRVAQRAAAPLLTTPFTTYCIPTMWFRTPLCRILAFYLVPGALLDGSPLPSPYPFCLYWDLPLITIGMGAGLTHMTVANAFRHSLLLLPRYGILVVPVSFPIILLPHYY